jgi:hypothetical protein
MIEAGQKHKDIKQQMKSERLTKPEESYDTLWQTDSGEFMAQSMNASDNTSHNGGPHLSGPAISHCLETLPTVK